MTELYEIEAIKRLKYRYLRCVDCKLWDNLEQCFTEDARAAYSDGKYSFEGRDRIMEFLRGAMSVDTLVTSHRVHHPEIELTGPTTASGIWALEDTVIETSAGITIRGAAFYEDEYAKVDGDWKIRVTGYRRTFETMVSHADTPSLQIKKGSSLCL